MAAQVDSQAAPARGRLTASDDELREAFRQLSGLASLDPVGAIAGLLDVDRATLTWYLYGPGAPRYRRFLIAKRRGGIRELHDPLGGLKALQRKFLQVLSAVYRPRTYVHGFVAGRSISTNAQPHVGAYAILNVDLEHFFPSINFGRVRGMFAAKPYNVPRNVAAVLAQLCCYKGMLPQGAPTSPIVANMVCGRLDSELARLARLHRCRFTRYADDLTFSTTRPTLPTALVDEFATPAAVGHELASVIHSNGFTVNAAKVRVRRRTGRLEVTGLVVNRRVNVGREFVRELRGMLHAWEAHGKEAAAMRFEEKYDTKDRWRSSEQNEISFPSVVRGKLDFLRMIRGVDDPVYAKLVGWYAELDTTYRPPTPNLNDQVVPSLQRVMDAVWVIESGADVEDVALLSQGTGFMLRGTGLLTCAHVVTDNVMTAFRSDQPRHRFGVKVRRIDRERDIAVLQFVNSDELPFGCWSADVGSNVAGCPSGGTVRLAYDAARAIVGRRIRLCGFPHYADGNSLLVRDATVVGLRRREGYQRLTVDGTIVTGMSGGPAVDDTGHVIGMIATGVDTDDRRHATDDHGVIPANVIRDWLRAPAPFESSNGQAEGGSE